MVRFSLCLHLLCLSRPNPKQAATDQFRTKDCNRLETYHFVFFRWRVRCETTRQVIHVLRFLSRRRILIDSTPLKQPTSGLQPRKRGTRRITAVPPKRPAMRQSNMAILLATLLKLGCLSRCFLDKLSAGPIQTVYTLSYCPLAGV